MRVKLGARHLVELGRGKCPAGKIRRSGYVRKDGTRVKSVCVPDAGAPGKTPAKKRFMPDLGPEPLKGWSKNKPASRRRADLKKIVAKKGCRAALRTINVIANVTTDRPAETKLRQDYKWVRKQDWCRLKTKQ
jgi:hypothetical protein